MSIASTIWFTIFGVIAYVLIIDPNVPVFLNLLTQGAWIKLRKVKFFLWENPDLPWVRWRIQRFYDHQTRLLRKELGLPRE